MLSYYYPLLSGHALNNEVCIFNLNCLSACIFDCHSHTAATGNLNKRRSKHVEEVLYSGRRHDSGSAAQRLPLHGDSNGNRANSAAGGNSDIAPKNHLVAGAALICHSAQGDDAGTIPVHNAVGAAYRRFREDHILISSNLLYKHSSKFSHKLIPFVKNSGEATAPPHLSQYRHGAEQSGFIGQLMYWVLAAAGAIAPAAGIGVGHLIGRDRHGVDTADQLGSLRLLIGGNKSILSRLGSLELQALVFSRQSRNLVLGQEVQDRPGVGVLIVDDIPGAVLDGVAGFTGLRRHVVVYAVNGALGIAAALGHLSAQAVKALLGLIAQGTNGIVHTVEAVAHGVPDGGLAVLEAIQRKPFIDVGAGCPALEAGAIGTAISAAEAAKTVAPTEHAEDQEQDDPGCPIASPATKATVSALVGRSYRHRHNSAVRRKTHCVISFEFYISKPGRDFD
nr:MAG TPA: hypothetical protein [Caudoviricetes sp.]